MFPVKIITRINRRSHDFTGNYANTFPVFFNWERGKPEVWRNRYGRRESRRVSIIHPAPREFRIHSGNIRDFRRGCAKGIRRAYLYISGDTGGKRKKKERVNQTVRHPAGRLSSHRQIAQMFHEIVRKSRWLCRAQKLSRDLRSDLVFRCLHFSLQLVASKITGISGWVRIHIGFIIVHLPDLVAPQRSIIAIYPSMKKQSFQIVL